MPRDFSEASSEENFSGIIETNQDHLNYEGQLRGAIESAPTINDLYVRISTEHGHLLTVRSSGTLDPFYEQKFAWLSKAQETLGSIIDNLVATSSGHETYKVLPLAILLKGLSTSYGLKLKVEKLIDSLNLDKTR